MNPTEMIRTELNEVIGIINPAFISCRESRMHMADFVIVNLAIFLGVEEFLECKMS
jgi:hypothetical protein